MLTKKEKQQIRKLREVLASVLALLLILAMQWWFMYALLDMFMNQ